MSENTDTTRITINIKQLASILAICLGVMLIMSPLIFNVKITESDGNPTPVPTPAPIVTQPPYHTTPNEVGCTDAGKGRFALQGDHLYYIDQGAILRQSVAGGTTAIMLGNTDADNLNILGDYLYYTTDQGIHRLNIYSLNQELICDIPAKSMVVRSDGIFFLCDRALMYCSKEGKNAQLVYDNIDGFASCGDDIIVSVTNPDYGTDLWCMGSGEPFATEVVVFTVRDNIVCAETSEGTYLYDALADYEATALPVSFELIPSDIMLTDSGIVYMPRNSSNVKLIDTQNGYERTIIENVDELFCLNNYIIYKESGKLYSCLENGWQIRYLANGLPPVQAPGDLICSNITVSASSDTLAPDQSTVLSVLIDSEPATELQLRSLAVYIKDNTVIDLTRNEKGELVVTATEKGQSIVRISGSESNVFAEILITVE